MLARIKHMKMQGLLVEVTPRAKLEIAQGRYTGLGMLPQQPAILDLANSQNVGLNAA